MIVAHTGQIGYLHFWHWRCLFFGCQYFLKVFLWWELMQLSRFINFFLKQSNTIIILKSPPTKARTSAWEKTVFLRVLCSSPKPDLKPSPQFCVVGSLCQISVSITVRSQSGVASVGIHEVPAEVRETVAVSSENERGWLLLLIACVGHAGALILVPGQMVVPDTCN
jgi:hypothetical protein